MVFNIYFVKLTQIFNQKDKTEFNRYIGSRRCGYPDKEAIEPYGALPRRGISYATRLKGLKGLKGILALTFDKFGFTQHRQNLKTSFFVLHSALVCLTLHKFG